MDDDIVFLGRIPATHTLPNNRPAPRPVIGVSLHVEKNGYIDSHCLSFHRVDSPVVNIGRRPTLDHEIDDPSSAHNASFRCAVVSRRHAKIAFSDSGHAYIIDLDSHHGTHIRSLGDRVARALKPETPTLLVHGDVITFGKSVGKYDECVRPIVARVELLHDPNISPTTSHTLSLSSFAPTPGAPKPSSGRYGIRTSSLSSSDESAENDGYSDIEEIPAPAQPTPIDAPAQAQSQRPQTSCGPYPSFKFRQLNAIRQYLPPIRIHPQLPWHYHNQLPILPHHPVLSHPQPPPEISAPTARPTLLPLSQLLNLSQFFHGTSNDTPNLDSASAGNTDIPNAETVSSDPRISLPACGDVIPPVIPPTRSASPKTMTSGFPVTVMTLTEPVAENPAVPSHSPNSSSCSPSLRASPSSEEDSDSNSDFSSSSSRDSERDNRERERELEKERERESNEPMDLSSRCSSPLSQRVPLVDKGKGVAVDNKFGFEVDEGGEKDMDIEYDHSAEEQQVQIVRKRLGRLPERVSQMDIRRIEEAVARLEADLTIHRGQTKATLVRHSSQMEVFDGRIREVDAECGVLCVRVETLGERVNAVELDVASNAEASFNAMENEADKERTTEEARMDNVHAMLALIAEARDELDALKTLRAEAEAYATRQKEQGREQPPVLPPSLKRKRDDSDEDVAADADEEAHGSDIAIEKKARLDATENEKDTDVVMDAHSLPLATSTSGNDSSACTSMPVPPSLSPDFDPSPVTESTVSNRNALPPPRKRVRRIAGIMARTATAVGVGAVVTWTALAFS